MTIPDWDGHGLEGLVRYCARPPVARERLGRLDDQHLVYRLRKPIVDGRTELILTPLDCSTDWRTWWLRRESTSTAAASWRPTRNSG